MKHNGFTIVELLVVVAIIALLAAIAIPQLQRFSLKSKRAEAVITLTTIHKWQMSYYTTNEQFFPKNAPQGGNNFATPAQVVTEFNLGAVTSKLGWVVHVMAVGGPPPGPPTPPRSISYNIELSNDLDKVDPFLDMFWIKQNFNSPCPDGRPIQTHDDIENRLLPC